MRRRRSVVPLAARVAGADRGESGAGAAGNGNRGEDISLLVVTPWPTQVELAKSAMPQAHLGCHSQWLAGQ